MSSKTTPFVATRNGNPNTFFPYVKKIVKPESFNTQAGPGIVTVIGKSFFSSAALPLGKMTFKSGAEFGVNGTYNKERYHNCN